MPKAIFLSLGCAKRSRASSQEFDPGTRHLFPPTGYVRQIPRIRVGFSLAPWTRGVYLKNDTYSGAFGFAGQVFPAADVEFSQEIRGNGPSDPSAPPGFQGGVLIHGQDAWRFH